MQVEFFVYPGKSREQLEFYTDILNQKNFDHKITSCELGSKLTISLPEDYVKFLAEVTCRFIFEFYLKESVLSKIYDEYPTLDTRDCVHILESVSEKLACSDIRHGIENLVNCKKSLCPESYFIFNMKKIMRSTYSLTDEFAKSELCRRQRQSLVNAMRVFLKLSFNSCRTADVEFSSDDFTIVSFDGGESFAVETSGLLKKLIDAAPQQINIKNKSLNPELSDVINEIFNQNK